MANFKKAFIKTLQHEGGYVNHKDDRGGETYKGITRRSHAAWEGWNIIDGYRDRDDFLEALKTDGQLELLVDALYKLNYWDKMQLDDIHDQHTAEELFDTGVNMGIKTAGEFLQEALNLLNYKQQYFPELVVDGIIGSKTIRAANTIPWIPALIKTLNGLQFAKYRNICAEDPTQRVFFRGWLKRT